MVLATRRIAVTMAKIRYFDAADLEAARAWLTEA